MSIVPTPIVSADSPELLANRPGASAFYVYRSVLILVWLAVPTVDDLVRLKSAVGQLGARRLGKVGVIQVLAPNTPMPSADVRMDLIRVWRPLRQDLAAMSLILNSGGFWGSAARAAINGMVLAASGAALGGKHSVAVRVHASLEEATEWLPVQLAERGGPVLQRAELQTVVRAAIDETR